MTKHRPGNRLSDRNAHHGSGTILALRWGRRESTDIDLTAPPSGGGLHRLAALVARAWFGSEALPGFGGKTAARLVREGHARYVHSYLDHVMAGGYT